MSSKSQKDAVAHLTNNEKLLLRWRLARCSEISRSALNWGLSGPKFHSQHRPLETAGSVPEVHPSYTPCHLATKTRGDKQARVCPDTARLFICVWPAASLRTRVGGGGRVLPRNLRVLEPNIFIIWPLTEGVLSPGRTVTLASEVTVTTWSSLGKSHVAFLFHTRDI